MFVTLQRTLFFISQIIFISACKIVIKLDNEIGKENLELLADIIRKNASR